MHILIPTHTDKFILALTKKIFKMLRKLDTSIHLKEIIILLSVVSCEQMKILGYYIVPSTWHCQINKGEIKKGHNLGLILCSKCMFSFKLLWHALCLAHLRGRGAVRWCSEKKEVHQGGWAGRVAGGSGCRPQAPAELCPSPETAHSDGRWLKMQRTRAHGQSVFVADRGQTINTSYFMNNCKKY